MFKVDNKNENTTKLKIPSTAKETTTNVIENDSSISLEEKVLEKHKLLEKNSDLYKLEMNIENKNMNKNSSLEKALNTAVINIDKPRNRPKPDDNTNIQNRSVNNKGFCYVGEDKNNRTCISVDESQKCMSGDIFPTKDICINPNLRYS